ncbi:SPOR domain-containing protein [Peristeroidobacter agariperforans]|uniref:SPOR domain-containing protein n=1 Tax=Peristeroidobacter agariperforans TaxID=268404 RepID=UPI00101D1F39|nr:SPOR domain-containing protein [Peristeroidobacter agariperforans]
MAKDYKHSKRRAGSSGLSGMAGFVCGLALGLAVALGVYLFDRRTEARLTAQQTAAPMIRDEAQAENKPAPASQEQAQTQEFDFYEMLPKYEVVIPEQDARGGAAPAVVAGPVEKPGAYILQAGSFRNFKDADRVKAMIAMQGVESKIQKVTIDKDTWHRVRVGPITNLQKLEDTRSKLRQAQIDALVIRVGE